jgi:hypothetical protein
MAVINISVAAGGAFFGYCLLKFPNFREHLLESAQDGDGTTHWIDAKNVVYLVLGIFAAWFTCDIAFVFAYAEKFEVGALSFLGIFVAVTFTLLGIAWKK